MKTYRFKAAFIVTTATLSVLRAQVDAPSVEDRLARLETAIVQIQEHASQAVTSDELAPALKELKDLSRRIGGDAQSKSAFVRASASETKLAVGGFVQAHVESGTAPDARFAGISDRFLLRRARLYLTGTFVENFSFKVESDFGNNSISPKTGLSGQLTDAYLAWTQLPAANLRIGQLKTPFGFEQLASDTKIYTVERSLPNDKLTLGRQIGGAVSGDLFGKCVNYSFGAYNGTGTNIGSNDSQKFLWAGRTGVVAFDGKVAGQKLRLSVGTNYFTTVDKGAFTGRRQGWGVDAQAVFGPAELQAEWLRNDQHPFTGRASAADGWALLGALNVTKQWQGIVRYETYDSNTAAANTTTNLWTFGVNYLIHGDDLKLSLDYLSGSQPAPTPHGDRVLGRVQVMF